jgi:hypothetical protein
MSFIPNPDIPKNKIGKEFITTRDFVAIKGTIPKGSLITVTGIDEIRGYSVRDKESGEEIIEGGWTI